MQVKLTIEFASVNVSRFRDNLVLVLDMNSYSSGSRTAVRIRRHGEVEIISIFVDIVDLMKPVGLSFGERNRQVGFQVLWKEAFRFNADFLLATHRSVQWENIFDV